jgi:hypothetical protein
MLSKKSFAGCSSRAWLELFCNSSSVSLSEPHTRSNRDFAVNENKEHSKTPGEQSLNAASKKPPADVNFLNAFVFISLAAFLQRHGSPTINF